MAQLRHKRRIGLNDIDGAGLLFYGNQFQFAQEAFEDFLDKIGYPLAFIIKQAAFLLPVVHVEADYQRKLEIGEEIETTLTVAEIGKSSFTLDFELLASGAGPAGRVRIIHVALNKETEKKTDLPAKFRQALERFRDGA